MDVWTSDPDELVRALLPLEGGKERVESLLRSAIAMIQTANRSGLKHMKKSEMVLSACRGKGLELVVIMVNAALESEEEDGVRSSG